ncbi:TPM domain-containing protein [Hymenobacter latericus]|uniref:TPM domain-containing protein n=1 Tax=Hymenobacter sp. YIM 151858-1 TaxID=2987688 RepID=UPI002225FDA1|nr:TPM domain-containing protein [Hymenobacter sp. YIM 151858-1]UYZ57959.1 TPM domain-containing protein [Hymenobacter sp. YIM 151858-1]
MFSRYLSLCLCALALLCASACNPADPATEPTAVADYRQDLPNPKTLGESYVSDPDSILTPATVANLNHVLRALDQSGRAHIDVALARSIGEAVPKTTATELFNLWQIGDRDKDNGLLMLLVLDQRRVEFETGYGLEAELPDAICYRIQQRYMLPHLRAQQYDAAVQQGVSAIMRQLATGSIAEPGSPADSVAATAEVPSENYAASRAPEDEDDGAAAFIWRMLGAFLVAMAGTVFYSAAWDATTKGHPHRNAWSTVMVLPFGLILLGLFADVPVWALALAAYVPLLLYLLAYLRGVGRTLAAQQSTLSRHQQYQYLQRTHHGLGFSRYLFALPLYWYWRRHRQRLQQLREAPYPCPHCQRPMQRLPETADDAHLQPGQRTEEALAAVDYDVWQCEPCQHTLVLDYHNPATEAKACPACHYHTLLEAGRQVVQRATRSAPGWGWQLTRCRHCGHEQKERYTIAQLSSPSSSSSGGSSYSSSSSGSSSSSSSGGSSGGGGAGSSW